MSTRTFSLLFVFSVFAIVSVGAGAEQFTYVDLIRQLTDLERLAVLEGRPELNGEVRYLCASIRRTLQDGVFGRYLEALRKDSDADRRAYYGGEG